MLGRRRLPLQSVHLQELQLLSFRNEASRTGLGRLLAGEDMPLTLPELNRRPKRPSMATLVARLILFLAVLLMPLGMTAAPAAAHQSMAAEMPMGHCPDQQRGDDHKAGIADCTMACAAALPAVEAVRDDPSIEPSAQIVAVQPHGLHGLHPETATPPPRVS